MKKSSLCCLAVMLQYVSIAQNSTDTCIPTFKKSYIGTGDYANVVNCIIAATDGSFVMAGYAHPFNKNGRTDGFVQKLDSRGNVLWSYSIGGRRDDLFWVVKQIPNNGGYILAGNTYSPGSAGVDYLWMVKIKNNGQLLWSKAYVTGGGRKTNALDVASTSSDKGFAICGYVENYALVIKTDSMGNLQWGKTFIGAKESLASGIIEDSALLLVTASDEQQSQFFQGVLMKLKEQNGDIIWSRAYDIDERNDLFSHVRKTKAGYVIYSTDEANRTDRTFLNHNILYTDRKGKPLNVWTVSNKKSQYSPAFVSTSDSGFLVTQSDYLSSDINKQLHLYKVSNSGNLQWARNFDFAGGALTVTRLRQLPDDGYILGGYNTMNGGTSGNGGALAIRTDKFGTGCVQDTSKKGVTITNTINYTYTAQFTWTSIVNGFVSSIFAPTVDSANTMNVTNFCSDCQSAFFYAALKSISSNATTTATAIRVYPNPAKDALHVTGLDASLKYDLRVVDELGNVLASTEINNSFSYIWNARRLSKGVYYINITSNQNKKTLIKFVKE